MAQWVSSLQNAPINLVALREDGCRQLFEILDALPGKTCMIVDPTITGPLKHIVVDGAKALKEHGVNLYTTIGRDAVTTSCESVLFLIHPQIATTKLVANQVRAFTAAGHDKHIAVFFVPRRTFICENVLKEEGVHADIATIGEYHIDLIPFDDDILSMELDTSFRECYLDGDSTTLYYVVRALLNLQALFGSIPHVKAKGTLSKIVLDMMLRVRREEEAEAPSATPEIDTLILLDREVDLVSPLVTPLTYEGLIDEIVGIENSFVQMDASVFAKEGDKDKDKEAGDGDDPDKASGAAAGGKAKKVTLALNSNDKLYAEIRDMNISAVTGVLQARSRNLAAQYAGRHEVHEISDIKKFVKKIPGMQAEVKSLDQFIKVTEVLQRTTNSPLFYKQWEMERAMLEELRDADVNAYLEGCICRREPVLKVLRLLCLRSVTQGGLKDKVFEYFRHEVVSTYGYEWLFTLNNLERLGLLRGKRSSHHWATLRRELRLLADEVKVEEPEDIHYVTSGYAPMSARIVQIGCNPNGWRDVGHLMKLLPGPTAEVNLEAEGGSSSASAAGGAASAGAAGAASGAGGGAGGPGGASGAGAGGDGKGAAASVVDSRSRKTVLVFFVGGVTYLEIAALRHLSEKMPYDFIVATTKLVSGPSLLESVVDRVENKLAHGTELSDDEGGAAAGAKA